MNSRRVLLSLTLAACATLALLGSQSAHAQIGKPSMPASVVPTQQGKLGGMWKRPGADMPGQAVGVLMEDGAPVYRIQVIVKRNPDSALPAGKFHGRLVLAGMPEDEPVVVATVHGKWMDSPDGPGRFKGVLLKPNPDGSERPLLAGKIKGHFFDPPKGKGTFGGKWVMFR